MDIEELKIRQLGNQHLLTPTDSLTVVRDLCCIQAQFLSNALHAIAIRSHDFQPQNTEQLIKTWAIRGTMHVFLQEDLPILLHEGRNPFLRPRDTLLEDENITQERKQYFANLIVSGIASSTDSREELKQLCTANGMTEHESESVFDPWGGTIRALCESGQICHKVQEKKAFCLCPDFTPLDAAQAELELARRYFTHYGPATVKDAAYFFGSTQRQVKNWLAHLPVISVSCNGKDYFYIESQTNYTYGIPDCLFLAGFDPLMLGYQKTESLYLPPDHLRKIFTMAGIVMPSVLYRGRVVGKWKKTGHKLLITLLEPIGPEGKNTIEAYARSLWKDLTVLTFA